MDESPATEPAASFPDHAPEREVKAGVTLPQKVSELRWKLGRKAKQEYRHLRRRSQRPFRPPEGVPFTAHLQALGLKLL